MLKLTTEAIEYAVDMCYKENRYRVIVVANTQEEVEHTLYDLGRRCRNHHFHLERDGLYLDNGSFIRIMTPSQCIRGFRCQLLICSDKIGYNNAMDLMQRLERYDWLVENNYYKDRFTREYFNRDVIENNKKVTSVDITVPVISEQELFDILGL